MTKLDLVQQRMVNGDTVRQGGDSGALPSASDPLSINLPEPPHRFSPPRSHTGTAAHSMGPGAASQRLDWQMQHMIQSTQNKTAAALRAAEMAQQQAQDSYRSVFLGTNHFQEHFGATSGVHQMRERESANLFNQIDSNGDGMISRGEFSGVVNRAAVEWLVLKDCSLQVGSKIKIRMWLTILMTRWLR